MNTEIDSVRLRMKKYLKHINMSEGVFEKDCGLGNAYVSKIGDSIRVNILKKITDKHPDLNTVWLLTGEGSMLKSDNSNGRIIDNLNRKEIPLVSQYAYAGYLCGFADEEYLDTLPTIPWDVDHEPKGEYIAIEVKGDSMDDRSYESILEGDVLYCRRLKPDLWQYRLHYNSWDFVIVHKTEGILVKRIINHNTENGDITIHSLNPLYEDRVINIQDVAQLFNVVESNRKKRR